MIDPLLLLLVLGAGLPIVARLSAAAAEVWILEAQSRLAAAASRLPAGAEVGARWKDGTMWVLRNRGAATIGVEEATVTTEALNGDGDWPGWTPQL